MNMKRLQNALIFVGSMILSGMLTIIAFRHLPIENTSLGLDWRDIWSGINRGKVTFGNLSNGIGGMFIPPWGIMFLVPLSFLSFRDSWGIISFITIVILVLSVPRLGNEKLDVVGIVLLVLSFPALRNLADGNLEGLVIGGIVLLTLGYDTSAPFILALGFILASVKFQETWLLCLSVFYYTIRNWSFPRQMKTFTFIGIIVSLSMALWGQAWLKSLFGSTGSQVTLSSTMGRGTLIDITLFAALSRLGMPKWLIYMGWALLFGATLLLFKYQQNKPKLSLEWVSLLTSASMLLAPYTSGNSFLTIMAVGVVPLMQRDRILGTLLIGLANLPYLATAEMLYYYQSYYWSFLLFVLWGISGWRILQKQLRNSG
jgi:hypothetical protein